MGEAWKVADDLDFSPAAFDVGGKDDGLKNCRYRMPRWQVEQIANSIDQFGFNDPIGVWTNPQGVCEIVEGHGRLLAAQKLGIEKVPVIRLDHLDDDARRAYVHVHNQTTMTSGFDLDKLQYFSGGRHVVTT